MNTSHWRKTGEEMVAMCHIRPGLQPSCMSGNSTNTDGLSESPAITTIYITQKKQTALSRTVS